MAEIKFKPDYGYQEASPFWIVILDDETRDRFPSRSEAEAEAALIAQKCPGHKVHLLAVAATVQTSPEVVGERFDPRRSPLPDPVEPFPEVEPPAAPLPVAEEE